MPLLPHNMKEKRGTHVGIIASFSIFVLFLVAMIFVIEPLIKTGKNKEVIADYVADKLISDFKMNLTEILVEPNSTGDMFYSMTDDLGFNPGNLPNFMIKDSRGNILNSGFFANSYILMIESSSEPVLWFYFANVNFSNTGFLSGPAYKPKIKSIRVTKEIFEEKIINITRDFDTIKPMYNVLEGSDFGFSFEMANGTIIDTVDKKITVDVYIKEIPITYIDNKANKLPGIIRVKVW